MSFKHPLVLAGIAILAAGLTLLIAWNSQFLAGTSLLMVLLPLAAAILLFLRLRG